MDTSSLSKNTTRATRKKKMGFVNYKKIENYSMTLTKIIDVDCNVSCIKIIM